MRVVRTTVVSILAFGLLAGSAVAVAAQEEETPSHESAGFRAAFEGVPREPITVDEESGLVRQAGFAFEATDPRASGLMTLLGAESFGPYFGIVKEGVRLINDEGAWAGTWVTFMVDEPDGRTKKQKRKGKGQRPVKGQTALFELTGEGGYDGLSMVGSVGPQGIYGVIMPTETVPTQPDVPAAPESPAQ